MASYWKNIVPLYLSLVVSFSLPIVEALAVEKIDITFLAYLGLVIPLTVIISTSARIYAQGDVFSHRFAQDQDGVAATVRTALVSLSVSRKGRGVPTEDSQICPLLPLREKVPEGG